MTSPSASLGSGVAAGVLLGVTGRLVTVAATVVSVGALVDCSVAGALDGCSAVGALVGSSAVAAIVAVPSGAGVAVGSLLSRPLRATGCRIH